MCGSMLDIQSATAEIMRGKKAAITRAVQPVATCRQSPYLHKPAIVIATSFATKLATPTVKDVRTYGRTDGHLTAINI